ncbi:MAG: hypothetical protein IJ217_00185 [Clostridia bacterium]|nr:hypothetical protein [Clostridia bacterium]
MKKENGVTLTSLTIYIITAGIIVVMLAFLNANFFSQMTELTNKTAVANEYSKFCSSFITDLKASNSVAEYNENAIKFTNGSLYEIRELKNADGTTTNRYAIYRNSVKLCENVASKYFELIDTSGNGIGEYVLSPYFDYDHLENTVRIILSFNKDGDTANEFDTQQIYLVGQGY